MAKNKQTTQSQTTARIETLLQQVHFFQQTANQDLTNADFRTRPGREAAKRDAEEALAGVLAEYEHELHRSLAGLFVTGPTEAVNEFSRIAAEEGPAAVVDVSAMYVQIASRVEAVMRGDRIFEPSQFATMLLAMTEFANSLDLRMVPTPNYSGDVRLATFEDVVAHVRKVIRDKLGDSLNEVSLLRQATEQAISLGFAKDTFPVVLKNATPEEAEGMAGFFGGKTVNVTVDEAVTTETVFDAFKALKTTILSQ